MKWEDAIRWWLVAYWVALLGVAAFFVAVTP